MSGAWPSPEWPLLTQPSHRDGVGGAQPLPKLPLPQTDSMHRGRPGHSPSDVHQHGHSGTRNARGTTPWDGRPLPGEVPSLRARGMPEDNVNPLDGR